MGIRKSEQLVRSEFITDADGNPTGGYTTMYVGPIETAMPGPDGVNVMVPEDPVLSIKWQDGIVGDDGQNGAFVEDVIEAVIQRLRFFQDSKFRCRENAIALTHIETGLAWLDRRTRARLIQNAENTYETHDSGG